MKNTTNLNLRKPESTDNVSIDDLNYNVDELDKEFKPTIDPLVVPSGNVGLVKTLLGGIVNRIKSITGKTNWWDTPSKTLEDLNTHIVNHPSVTLATATTALTSGGTGAVGTSGNVARQDHTHSLPAYPTTLPANDVYAWAKSSTKPTYIASEVGALASGGTAVNSNALGGVSLATLRAEIKANGGDIVGKNILHEQIQIASPGAGVAATTFITLKSYSNAKGGMVRMLNVVPPKNSYYGYKGFITVVVDGVTVIADAKTEEIISSPNDSSGTSVIKTIASLDIPFKTSVVISLRGQIPSLSGTYTGENGFTNLLYYINQ